jgi:hypothetical protein
VVTLGVFPAGAAKAPDDVDPSRGCTIVGTKSGDVLTGTDGDDVICGGGGGDTIKAGAGNDVIYGDDGGDTIWAGDGDDIVYGGAGGDTIHGQAGADRLLGGDGGDTIWGEDGDDLIQGEAGADTARGGDGADTIVDTGKADTLWGDAGDDLIVAGLGADSVKGNAGDDRLFGGPGNDSHYGDAGSDTCVGGAGANAYYSCEYKPTAAQLGGTDGDTDGDGASDVDEALAGTDPLVPDQAVLGYGLSVDAQCRAGLALSATAQEDPVTVGQDALFDLMVRNDPSGACLQAGSNPTTVAGTLQVESTTSEDVVLGSVVAWLEVPAASGVWTVLPQGAGLVSSGGSGADGCPVGAAGGCALELGDVVGNVSLTQGQGQTVAAAASLPVEFRYFPQLAASDRVLLSQTTEARLALAVTETGGTVAVTRAPLSFGTSPATGPVAVEGALPSGASSIQMPSVPAGEQREAVGQFRHNTANEAAHTFTAIFTASAPAAPTATAEVAVGVESDRSGLSPVHATLYPQRATIGQEQEFTVSVHPRAQVTGQLTIAWESGSAELRDDGSSGDLAADNGVYTARFTWAPTAVGLHTLLVTGVADGRSATSEVKVAVYDTSVPTRPYSGPVGEPLIHGRGEYRSDLVDVYAAPGADVGLVAEAVDLVGGRIVGAVLLDAWQVLIPAATTWEELEAVIGTISGHPAIEYADAVGIIRSQAVEPNDPEFPDQENLQDFDLRDAWAFNPGRVRTVVAVIDGGFEVDHPDLDDNITAGWDFADDDDDVAPEVCGNHGTHVAGIIGAETDNGIGVAGVNWNVELLVHKVFWSEFNCLGDDDARGSDPVLRSFGCRRRQPQPREP